MMRSTLARALAFAAAAQPAYAGFVDLSSATLPVCSSTQTTRFDAVWNTQATLDVYDPDGHYIGWTEADGIFWRNWEPVDAYKHAACGTQHHYSFYNPWYSGDEDDANKYVVPSAVFSHIITDPVAWGYSNAGDVHTCGGVQCFEAEITHDQSYAGNPWFPHTDPASSPINGKAMCNYGPWIADHGHGGRPEIHPSEAMWWRTAPTPAGLLHEIRVVLMQDDSNRYDRRADYTPDMPSNIKPWSGVPRTAYVRQAFRVPAVGGTPEYLHVYEAPRLRNVTTASNASLSPDATVGTQHVLRYDGATKLTVVEHQPDANLGVVFDETPATTTALHDICRRGDGQLQGYVTLRTQFGVNDRGGEGYHELVLHRTTSATDPAAASAAKGSKAPPRKLVLGADVDWSTVQAETTPDGLRLVGDVLVRVVRDAPLRAVRTDDKADVAYRLEPSAKRTHDLVRLAAIDLASGRRLAFEFASGETDGGDLPGLGVSAELSARAHAVGDAKDAALDTAWAALVARVDGERTARPASFVAVAWTLEATPAFAPLKEGKVSPEDELAIAKRLNRDALAGRATPITLDRAVRRVAWSGASLRDAKSPWQRELAYADPAALAEDTVRLEIADAFGGEVVRTHRVASHALLGDADALAAALPALVGDLAGSPTLAAPAAGAEDDYTTASRQHRQLAHLVVRDARDGVVTPDELAHLVALARSLR